MAKRGDVPAMNVGKFWRYRATTLDAWINSRPQSGRQPCRMKPHFEGRRHAGTLRQTYSTLLRALGTDVKVQQELLRHADVSTTLNIYTQAVSEQKREAAGKIARLLLQAPKKEEGPRERPLVVPTCTRLM
jgi:integrase